MKLRKLNDHKREWQTTVTSIVMLVFTVLVAVGLLSAEQSAIAQDLVINIVISAAGIVTGVKALIDLLFKKEPA